MIVLHFIDIMIIVRMIVQMGIVFHTVASWCPAVLSNNQISFLIVFQYNECIKI